MQKILNVAQETQNSYTDTDASTGIAATRPGVDYCCLD